MGMCCSKFGGSYLIKKEDGNVTKNGAGATPKITKVDTIIDNGIHYLKLFFCISSIRKKLNYSKWIQFLLQLEKKQSFVATEKESNGDVAVHQNGETTAIVSNGNGTAVESKDKKKKKRKDSGSSSSSSSSSGLLVFRSLIELTVVVSTNN